MGLVESAIQSRFKGCLIGGLVGDALGAPWEFVNPSSLDGTVGDYFQELLTKSDAEIREYTDDTAMTMSILDSLIANQNINAEDLAQRFCTSYFADHDRGYASTVGQVFEKLKDSNYVDSFQPAGEQFNGSGSFGNGAAMRISPLGIFFATDEMNCFLAELIKSCRLTHSHPVGICGGIFQAIAVREAFLRGVRNEPSLSARLEILHSVEMHIQDISNGKYSTKTKEVGQFIKGGMGIYVEKLAIIRGVISKGNTNVDLAEIRETLGNGVVAQDSVPTAFYCFLAGFENVPNIQTENHFHRTIQLAISLGGDTDTIASMAGSIAGAYLGIEKVPEQLVRHCESAEALRGLTLKLYKTTPARFTEHFHKTVECSVSTASKV